MADTKASAFTATTALTDDDTIPVIEDQDGTPLNRQITWANFRAAFGGCRAYRSSAGSNISTSTPTAVEFNAELSDTHGYHDNATNPSRLTVPTTGSYDIAASVRLALNAASKKANLYLYKNGSRILIGPNAWSVGAAATVWAVISAGSVSATAGDYFEIYVNHDAAATPPDGDATGENTWFSIQRVG